VLKLNVKTFNKILQIVLGAFVAKVDRDRPPEFATSTHHVLNENEVQCLHSANERPTVIVWTTGQQHR